MTLDGLPTLDPGERMRAMDEACLRAFSTDDGQVLLARLLEACKFLDHASGEAEQALNNFGKFLLGLAGVNSTSRLIAAMMRNKSKE